MSQNTPAPIDDFAAAVTKFASDFVESATPAEIDRFLEEGGVDFYNQVQSPAMIAPSAETHRILFHGSFWALVAAPVPFRASADFAATDWAL